MSIRVNFRLLRFNTRYFSVSAGALHGLQARFFNPWWFREDTTSPFFYFFLSFCSLRKTLLFWLFWIWSKMAMARRPAPSAQTRTQSALGRTQGTFSTVKSAALTRVSKARDLGLNLDYYYWLL